MGISNILRKPVVLRLGEAAAGGIVGGGVGAFSALNEDDAARIRAIASGIAVGVGTSVLVSRFLRKNALTELSVIRQRRGVAGNAGRPVGVWKTRGGVQMPSEAASRELVSKHKDPETVKQMMDEARSLLTKNKMTNLADTVTTEGSRALSGRSLSAYLQGSKGFGFSEYGQVSGEIGAAYKSGQAAHAFRFGMLGQKRPPGIGRLDDHVEAAFVRGANIRGDLLSNKKIMSGIQAEAGGTIKMDLLKARKTIEAADEQPRGLMWMLVNKKLWGRF